MFSPFSTLPQKDYKKQATVLLVGPPGSGKRTLSRSLITHQELLITTRTAGSLPLPASRDRPRIDFIVFMVDMTNRVTFDSMRTALDGLGEEWWLGRCGVVVTRVDKVSQWTFERDELDEFIESIYEIPIISTNLSVPSHVTTVASQLHRVIEIACGHIPNMTPAIMRTPETREVISTSFND